MRDSGKRNRYSGRTGRKRDLMIRQKERERVLMVRQFEKIFIGTKYRKRDRLLRN